MNFVEISNQLNVDDDTLLSLIEQAGLEVKESYSDEELNQLKARKNKLPSSPQPPSGNQSNPAGPVSMLLAAKNALEAQTVGGLMASTFLQNQAEKVAEALAKRNLEIIENIPGLTDYYFQKEYAERYGKTQSFNKDYEVIVEDLDREWQEDLQDVQGNFAELMAHAHAHAIAGA